MREKHDSFPGEIGFGLATGPWRVIHPLDLGMAMWKTRWLSREHDQQVGFPTVTSMLLSRRVSERWPWLPVISAIIPMG